MFRKSLFVLSFLALHPAIGQDVKRITVDLPFVEEIAKEKAANPYVPPHESTPLPDSLLKLDYSQYQKITFDGPKALWVSENLNFRLMPMHAGYLFVDPVVIHEATATHVQRLRFTPDWFRYENQNFDPRSLPDTIGYSGFQLGARLNSAELFNEFAVFQGASYYRMTAKDQAYGLSSRGLALNTALPDAPEEFPLFTRHWLIKPLGNQNHLVMYSLLESPSVTGAYQFTIHPGAATKIEVKATLFFRSIPKSIGISPMSSMFWFGENSKTRYDDYRPEVHDSDGMVIKSASGEALWRPISHDPTRVHVNSFLFEKGAAFGLVQRDRDYAHYLDPEAAYHRRPGLWVEPVGDWGPGTVKLIELTTPDETNDNIVLFWEPATPPVVGQPWSIAYNQYWTADGNPAKAGSYTIATRTGAQFWEPGKRMVVLEFAGPTLDQLPENTNPEAVVTLQDPTKASVTGVTIHRNKENGLWRVTFLVEPTETNMADGFAEEREAALALIAKGQKPGLLPPRMREAVEMRCFLRLGNDILSETWSWRMDP